MRTITKNLIVALSLTKIPEMAICFEVYVADPLGVISLSKTSSLRVFNCSQLTIDQCLHFLAHIQCALVLDN